MPGSAGPFTLTLWTNDPALAKAADRAGVDRIGLDLETVGKADRQRGHPTWLTTHERRHLAPVRAALERASLFVRANPLHEGSSEEVGWLLGQGAEVIMLPSFQRAEEVERFAVLVDGRAKVVPLVERVAAVAEIPRLAALPGIEEIHVGLNDLSIDMGLNFRMAVLVEPLMQEISGLALASGLRLGIGGIGRAGDESLPAPSDLIYAQLCRLGASGALLARSFFDGPMSDDEMALEIRRARERLETWRHAEPHALESAHAALVARLAELAS